MSKMNVKESLLEVVKSNNLEILKIDLFNDFELFVREGTRVRNEYCKTYATLDDLDFEVEAFLLNDEVRGIYTAKIKTQKNLCGLNLGVMNAILGGRLAESQSSTNEIL